MSPTPSNQHEIDTFPTDTAHELRKAVQKVIYWEREIAERFDPNTRMGQAAYWQAYGVLEDNRTRVKLAAEKNPELFRVILRELVIANEPCRFHLAGLVPNLVLGFELGSGGH